MIQPPAEMKPADSATPMRPLIMGLLLAVGVEFWLTLGKGYWRRLEPRFLLGALIVCAIPQVNRRLYPLIERLRGRPRPGVAIAVALLLTVAAAAYVPYDAVKEGRALAPRVQDHYSYLIQAQQVARGRLWMRPHPLGDFFECFQLIAQPVYASIYFPGTAMLMAPGVWLGLPTWVMPCVASGAVVGATYLVITYLVDSIAGLLAAGLIVALPTFRISAIQPTSQIAETLLSLLAIATYLAWRRERRMRWAVVTGVMLGWAAITRPIDAMCVGVPVGVAILTDLRGARPGRGASYWVRALAPFVIGAAPLLAVMAVQDWGITGSVFSTPYNLYVARNLPGAQYGFPRYDPTTRPASPLIQQQEFFEGCRDAIASRTPMGALRDVFTGRARRALLDGVPHVILLGLVPLGVFAVFRGRRWVLAAMGPMYLLMYWPHVFSMAHYDLISAPAVAVIVVSAITVVPMGAKAGVVRTWGCFAAVAVAILVFGQYRELNRLAIVDPVVTPEQNNIDRVLPTIPGRAIVLFRYPGNGLFQQEPCYNYDVPWPDDARVIRAHDLGPAKDPELFKYYAAIQPDREVYRYERNVDRLIKLGNVRELAADPSKAEPAPAAATGPSHGWR